MTLYDTIIPGAMALLSAAMSILWTKADRAERISDTNRIMLNQLIKNIEKTNLLTERISSLEAGVQVEIKTLSNAIKRLESAILRLERQ